MSRWQETFADLIIRRYPDTPAAKWLPHAHVFDASDIIKGMGSLGSVEEARAATKRETIGPIAKPFNKVWIEGWNNVEGDGERFGTFGAVVVFSDHDDSDDDCKWSFCFNMVTLHERRLSWTYEKDLCSGRICIGRDGLIKRGAYLGDVAPLWTWACFGYPICMALCLASRGTRFVSIKEPDAEARRKHIRKFGTDLIVHRKITIPRVPVIYKGGGHDGTPRRLHWVSGHWKPPLSQPWLGEGERPYIEPYLRGDPRLGFCKTSYWAKAAMGAMVKREVIA